MDGCLWDAPCETRFSNDGTQAVVINRNGGHFLYKNDVLNALITVWDMAGNKEVSSESGAFRDLESVLVRARWQFAQGGPGGR